MKFEYIYKTGGAASITYKNPFAIGIEEMAGKDDFTVQSPRRYGTPEKKVERRDCWGDSWKYSRFSLFFLFVVMPRRRKVEKEKTMERKEGKCTKGYFSFNGLKKTTIFNISQCFVCHMKLFLCATLLSFRCLRCNRRVA